MRRDDRDDSDPFDDLFDEIERMMNDMMGGDIRVKGNAGFGSDVHLDIYDDDDEVRVVADMPGVEKDGIDLKCDGETLTIDAASGTTEYREQVRLPARVDEHTASATYNNGILEVTFDRADDSASIDLS